MRWVVSGCLVYRLSNPPRLRSSVLRYSVSDPDAGLGEGFCQVPYPNSDISNSDLPPTVTQIKCPFLLLRSCAFESYSRETTFESDKKLRLCSVGGWSRPNISVTSLSRNRLCIDGYQIRVKGQFVDSRLNLGFRKWSNTGLLLVRDVGGTVTVNDQIYHVYGSSD